MKWLFPTDICVVTGGNSGLGLAILEEFAKQGCQTVSLDIKPPPRSSGEKVCADTSSSDPVEPPAPSNETDETANVPTTAHGAAIAHASAHDAISVHEDAITLHSSQPVNDIVFADFSTEDASAEVASTGVSETGVAKDVTSTELGNSTARDSSSAHEDTGNVSAESCVAENEAPEDLTPTLYVSCDVRSESQLQEARNIIFKRFNRYPSIIVLNAAIRRPLHSIVESDFADLQDTLDVNLGGFIKCLRTFLPDMVQNQRGFVVSVASALGLVVPKGLGAYGASKSGVMGIHEALEQELEDYKGVHALLVCPGQLDTAMFSDVKTPSSLLAPVVPPTKLAKKIVKRVIKANTSTLYAPSYVRYLPFMRTIPVPLARLTRKFAGVDKVYDDIVAERKKAVQFLQEKELSVDEAEMGASDTAESADQIVRTEHADSDGHLAHSEQAVGTPNVDGTAIDRSDAPQLDVVPKEPVPVLGHPEGTEEPGQHDPTAAVLEAQLPQSEVF